MKNLNGPLSVVALLAEPFAANATLVGPIPYRCFADYPSVRAAFSAFPLENFENDAPGEPAAIVMPFGTPYASNGNPFDPDAGIGHAMEDAPATGHTWFMYVWMARDENTERSRQPAPESYFPSP